MTLLAITYALIHSAYFLFIVSIGGYANSNNSKQKKKRFYESTQSFNRIQFWCSSAVLFDHLISFLLLPLWLLSIRVITIRGKLLRYTYAFCQIFFTRLTCNMQFICYFEKTYHAMKKKSFCKEKKTILFF